MAVIIHHAPFARVQTTEGERWSLIQQEITGYKDPEDKDGDLPDLETPRRVMV